MVAAMNHTKLVLATALLAFGCKSEIDGKTAAQVSDAKPAPAEVAKPEGEGQTFKVDAASSKISFVGAKITGDHTGEFKRFTGEVTLVKGAPQRLSFTIETESVETDAEGLTKHLKSADFFDVEKFPTAEFTGTKFEPHDPPQADGSNYTIHGELALHGVKKAISFPAKVEIQSTEAKGSAEFTLNRSDFEIVYPGKPDDLIKNEVLLKLNLRFVP